MPDTVLLAISYRSGSNCLRSMLEQNKDISAKGEIFRPYFKSSNINRVSLQGEIDTRLNRFRSRQDKNKVFLYTSVVDEILKLEEYNLIHDILPNKSIFLYRKDLLEQYCSVKVGKISGIYQDTEQSKQEKQKIRIEFNLNEYLNFVARMNRHRDFFVAFYKRYKISYITIEYSSILTRIEEIFKFLDLDYNGELPTTIKSESRPLHEIITNFKDIPVDMNHKLVVDDVSFA